MTDYEKDRERVLAEAMQDARRVVLLVLIYGGFAAFLVLNALGAW